jgi:L-seryl-tRNA(Ser) seleniumtransferase
MPADLRSTVPSVDAIMRSGPGVRAATVVGRRVLKRTLVEQLELVRRQAADGAPAPTADEILAKAAGRASTAVVGLAPVVNATGVILHTNLGRAPLSEAAITAAARAARGYADLEVDRLSGRRGRRSGRAELLLASLTDAEDAFVVNNCAAALLLALGAIANNRDVLVSRGEIIEIGGEFRIPDIVAAAGARLREVGTTNRTRVEDYRSVATDGVAAILKVHPSNYRVVGFTTAPEASDLAALARELGVPFLYDVGSGVLDHDSVGSTHGEPTVVDALSQGADLVTFSADKLLGGPQAGCIVGRTDVIDRLRRHPIARAVRVDKMQTAALEATLAMHALGTGGAVPVRRMMDEPVMDVARRAQRLAEWIDARPGVVRVVPCMSTVGGGAMPGVELESYGVAVEVPEPVAFAARLRAGSPPAFCRVEQERALLDCRTVPDESAPDLARAVRHALEADGSGEP